MRDIRFRIWNENLKEMIKDIHICPQYGWLVMSDNDAIAERGRVSEEDLIWMQYTGLKDKNNKEVYEGDIVMFDYDWTKSTEIGVVTWNNDNASFQIKGHIPSSSMKHLKQMKIIGNIYQNKKILEKEGK